MNMIRSTRTPPEYYERCSDESTLDEAKDLLTAAYENLDVIDFSVNHFEDFQIKLAVAISHIKAANNIKLNNAINIVKDAQKSLARLEKQATFADEIIADASRGIEKIERELRNKASMFAEDTPMFDENAEHRTY